MAVSRRDLLVLIAQFVPSRWTGDVVGATSDSEFLQTIALLRRSRWEPRWFTSSNWVNPAYEPWTEYIAGRITTGEYRTKCPQRTAYCLLDDAHLRYQLGQELPEIMFPSVDWGAVNSLAVRYYQTGDAVFSRKWLAIVERYAIWTEGEARRANSQLQRGNSPELLSAAVIWSGIFAAMAVIAKGIPSTVSERRSGNAVFDPNMSPVALTASEILSPSRVTRIANSYANGAAMLHMNYYALARYVPNQRLQGLETVAYLCTFFPWLPAVRPLQSGLHVSFLDILDRYTQKDGGQLEQSFNYNQGAINTLRRLVDFPLARSPDWRDQAQRTITGWQRVYSSLATPDGGLPQVGNSVWARTISSLPVERIAVPSIAFPFSGLYAMRSAWTPDAGYLFFFVRRAARGHSMAGSNSVQVAAFGRQLLAAGGSASYNAETKGAGFPAAYLAEESTFKTSSLVVDGRSQRGGITHGLPTDAQGKPDITSAPAQPLRMRWHSSAHFDYAEGVYDQGYERLANGSLAPVVADVTHWRQVVFLRPLMAWAIVDVLRTRGQHRYTQIWKFSAPQNGLKVPGFQREQVEWDEERRQIRTRDRAAGAVNVLLQQFGSMRPSYRGFFGESGYGYFNPGPLTEPVPALDVHVAWSGHGPQVLVTLVAPYRAAVLEGVAVKDLTTLESTGFSAEWANGSNVSVLASSSPASLRLAGSAQEDGDLLIRMEIPGQPTAVLAIHASRSREIVGGQDTLITAPDTFHWSTDATGALRPVYA
jgi:hypothetical protein